MQAPKVLLRSVLIFLGVYIGLIALMSSNSMRKPMADMVRSGLGITLDNFSDEAIFRFFPRDFQLLTDHDLRV